MSVIFIKVVPRDVLLVPYYELFMSSSICSNILESLQSNIKFETSYVPLAQVFVV